MAKKTFDYFDMFNQMGQISKEAALFLQETLENYSNKEENLTKMHAIEHSGDRLHHRLIDEINRSFITPIEREDIINLGGAIDEFTDTIEDIVLNLYMFNVESLRSEALEFGKIILQACDNAILALNELKNMKKSNNDINKYIIEVNNCEENADRVYHRAMRRLFVEEEKNPIELIRWRELFNVMEDCLDAVENLASIIGTVVMKNS